MKLASTLSGSTLTVTGPPTARIYPPGPGFLYVVTDAGVPSFGHKTLVGDGSGPPVDQAAINKYVLVYSIDIICSPSSLYSMLANTNNPNFAPVETPTSGEGSVVATEVIPA